MSSSLVWRPVVIQESNCLEDQLKFILRKRYGDPVNVKMDHSDIVYLNGLVDSEVKGASELIEIIQKHGEISVAEEW